MEKRYLNLSEYCLVPGPLELREPATSLDATADQIYTPEEMVEAILAVPRTRLVHPAHPGWRWWKAGWKREVRFIELGISDCPIYPDARPGVEVAWGGSGLWTHCLLSDVLEFWEALRTLRPGIWLHDTSCRMWSPSSFAREYQDG